MNTYERHMWNVYRAFVTWGSFSDTKFKALVHSRHVSRCFSIPAATICMPLLSCFYFCLAVSVHVRLNNRISHNVGVTGDETCWWHLTIKKVFMNKFVRDQWRVSISFNISFGPLFKGISLKTAWNSCDCFRESSGDIEHCIAI